MSTTTITATILATDTTEALPADTLALGVAAFGAIWGRHFPGDEIPSEMHTARGWAGPDSDDALTACDDDLTDAAGALEHKPSGEVYVCLEGQGIDGSDVWALARIHDAAAGLVEAECIYCGATHAALAEVPALGDDATWTRLAKEHGDGCEWIATRAHRVEVVRVFLDGAEAEDWANSAYNILRDSGVWVREGVDGCTSWDECSGMESGDEYVTLRVESIAEAAECLGEHGYRVTANA